MRPAPSLPWGNPTGPYWHSCKLSLSAPRKLSLSMYTEPPLHQDTSHHGRTPAQRSGISLYSRCENSIFCKEKPKHLSFKLWSFDFYLCLVFCLPFSAKKMESCVVQWCISGPSICRCSPPEFSLSEVHVPQPWTHCEIRHEVRSNINPQCWVTSFSLKCTYRDPWWFPCISISPRFQSKGHWLL